MPRSNRRQGKSSGRQHNPQSWESGSGGFEQTGTGYRYDDQQRRFGQQSEGSWRGGSWPGREEWSGPSDRSRYSQGRDYEPGYEQGSRFGRAGYEGQRNTGGQRSGPSQGYPESWRGFGGQNWGQQGRDDWNQEDESRYGRGNEEYGYGGEEYRMEGEGEYEGYEPGFRERTGRYRGSASQSGGQQRYMGSSGQGFRGSFGTGSRQFGERRSMRDQEQQQSRGGLFRGSFAGRGPQGYKRSDERITEDINEMLTQDPDIDASNISVDVQGGEVTLKGTVSDREDKRRAEDIAESASGVKDVQNQIRVKREDESETESGKREKSEDKRSHRQQIAS